MWSSEHTLVLSAPASVATSSAVDRPWELFSAQHSPSAIIGVPAGCQVETILKERLPEPQRHQRSSQQPRPSARSNRRAIFGRLRGMLSRSRSSGKGAVEEARGTVRPSYLVASSTVPRPATDTNMYKSAPAPRRRRQNATTTTTATAASGEDRTAGGGDGDKPRTPPERGGREENFHAALDNKLVHVAFAAHCKRTLSSENVEFVRQVRELEQLSAAEGTTTSELCEKLRSVAAEFVSPDSATEVNVKGSSRQDVLCSIQAALEAADYNYGGDDNDGYGGGGGGGGRNGESPWARVLTIAATEALVGLARQVHTVIFDGIWPRFLGSDEFAVLMKREEMRTTGFTDLDGKVIVSALPPPHPGAGGSAGGDARGKPSTPHKRQLSSILVSSFRVARLAGGGGGRGRGGGMAQEEGEEIEATVAAATRSGPGSPERESLSGKTSPASNRSLSMTSGLSSTSSASSTGSCGDPRCDVSVTACTGETPAVPTANTRPPLGRRSFARPMPASSSSSARPPRIAPHPDSIDSSQHKQHQQHQQHGLGGLTARWVGTSRARKGAGGGWSGVGSSPASPTKVRMCTGARSSAPFSAAATARRAFSLR